MGADGDSIDMKDLVNVLQSKYPGLNKFQPKPMTDLPPKVQARVETLKELQGQHDELEKKFLEEKAALEAKYLKLYEPLYSKRSEIVNGADEGSANDTKMANGEAPTPDEEKGIPEFWLNALKAHPLLAMEITERDEGALKFLKDIKWCRITEAKGFKIEFFFDENPYFKNTVLTKTYHMVDEDEPIMEKSIGTEIEWLPGKCLTQKLLKKKPRKGSKNSKPITKLEDCPSFFNFFKPPEVPEEDDDLDEDATEELQALMEQDYDVGSIIRDKIIPRAVTFFTGEADVEDEYGFDEEDDDDDDDDDEEEDEVEDDEDDSEDEAPQKKKLGGKAKKPTKVKQEEQPAECKQQ